MENNSQIVEDKLKSFGVDAKVTEVLVGPVVTRYVLNLDEGVKVSKVTSLTNDLAIALKAQSVMVLAPIPGTNKVGIEIPNEIKEIVHLKDVMKSEEFKTSPDSITIALGKDVNGNPFTADLTKTPHLLIAGRTGAGKSVCVNSIISSILLTKSSEEVKLLLIDPKLVELKPYRSVPHLVAPVVTDPDMAVKGLKWAVEEMERRYNILAENNVRNIASFNNKNTTRMPYIVVIIDEFGDLMMTSGKLLEHYVIRIAQKARAVGIHLILTTQRPSIDVITGNIKANLPSRIGFQVSSQVDARTIMDNIGCERLLGNGDMLFQGNTSPDPIRLHGSYVSDSETEEIVANTQTNEDTYYLTDFNEETEVETPKHSSKKLIDKARKLCKEHNNYTLSFIQRSLNVDYTTAESLTKEVLE